jgi:aspartate aminotransferase
MTEAATLKMAQAARARAAEGHDVLSLSIGEPDFDTPDHIKQAAIEAMQAGRTKYTPAAGLPQLKQAICDKFQRDNKLHFSADQIVVSNGAKQSLYNTCMALLNPGDQVILPAPYWVSYEGLIQQTGAEAIVISTDVDTNFKLQPEQLRSALNNNCRMLLFSNPSNPTGSVYHRDELMALATVLADFPNCIVVSDEIYEYIHFEEYPVSIGSLPGMAERTVTVNGFSKGFAMTGWRLGYIGAPLEVARACTKIQGACTTGANAFVQLAGAHALEASLDASWHMRDVYRRRRDLVVDLLRQIPGLKVTIPEGAFYSFPDASSYFGKRYQNTTINNSDQLSLYLLEQANVAVVAGEAFGDDRCFRISFATSDDVLVEAIDRIRLALALLN